MLPTRGALNIAWATSSLRRAGIEVAANLADFRVTVSTERGIGARLDQGSRLVQAVARRASTSLSLTGLR